MKKIIEDKRILTFYVIVIAALTLGVTYALRSVTITANVTTALMGVDETAYGSTSFDSSNIDFEPIFDSEVETSFNNVIKINFMVGGASTNNINNIIYDIALVDLEFDESLYSPYIKWKLVKDGVQLSTGSFDDETYTINEGRLVLTTKQLSLPDYNVDKTGYHNYSFYMWFSDSCQSSDIASCIDKKDQSYMIGKSFSGRIEVELYVGKTANSPNLDNGNLIPVYYDDTVQASDGTYGVWKKADSTNSNNSWYNYENKMWANAIIVSNDTLSTYQSAEVGTTITDTDIIAFYVWIPRYKYRVWNITRQGGDEDTYAYPAYSTGIEIQFETGTASTGNVECTYDITTEESETDLSDVCVYNGTDTITTDSGNTNYNDAWYTHPAFTFGDEEVEGFWIGKFETSATTSSTCYTSPSATNCSNANQEPRILPNVSSLRSQTVSYQFTTAKKFQKYFSDDIEAHMLTNLEWGAVAYLTHSIYGLCDASGCKGLKFNNSEGYFTGRSGGDIARNALKAAAFYGDTSLSAENIYIQNGYYNYKGYKLNSSGVVTSTKDVSAIASTTGNVTGIYDMAGGSNEYVMGNMADSAGLFYSRLAGTNWNGNSILDTKYYNAYSFGINSYKPIAFNRARLGDAIAENLGSSTSNIALWSPGYGVTGSSSQMFFDDGETQHYWLHRGGNSKSVYSSIFYLYRASGDSSSGFSFRSSIS